jgi:hypothetical protein
MLTALTIISFAQLPIVYYDFENNSSRSTFQNVVEQSVNSGSTAFTSTGVAAPAGATGAGTYNAGPVTGQSLNVANNGTNVPASDPGISATNYVQFSLNTSGFSGISLKFDVYSYGPGGNYCFIGALVSYNGGTSYAPLITGFDPASGVWSATSGTLTSAGDNNANVRIRIYSYTGNKNNAGFRIDNVTLYALGTVAGGGIKNMLDEENIYTSNTSGLTANMYPRKNFTVTGAGTTVNLSPVKFTGTANGTGGNITVSANAVLNIISGTLSPLIDSAHGTVPVSTLTVAGGTVNLNTTLICGGNINITGGSLLLNSEVLKLGGTVSHTAGTFNSTAATIDMIGVTAQTLPANAFLNNAVKSLVISNSSAGGVSLGGALDVYSTLSFTGTGKTINTNDLLTLKSTATETAAVAEIPVNASGVALNYINGKVTVERYISARKAWRFLSIPTNTTQTIKETWQENQPTGSTALAGYGFQITGNMANWAAMGFDLLGVGNSAIKTYNSALSGWDGVSSTLLPIKTNRGYMTIIRGDRTANAGNSVPTPTVLRTTGALYTGTQPAISVGLNLFNAVGNPYASRLDLRNINKSSITDIFYVWDPKLGSLGGYQTMIPFLSNYYAFPGGGSYNPFYVPSNYIESGQAFFVTTTSLGGSIIMKEDAKADGSAVVSRTDALPGQRLITSLYYMNTDGSKILSDATINDYDDSYSNTVDQLDAKKMSNLNENLSIKTTDSLLVLDRKHTITTADTIFFNLTGVKLGQYQFEFLPQNINLTMFTAYLEDSYTQVRTPLDLTDTARYTFTIANIAASYAADRFRIVFKPLAALPVTITSISASRNTDATVSVEWKAENEIAIERYELEHSVKGTDFTKMASLTPSSNNGGRATYHINDAGATASAHYYRIKAISTNGLVQYSAIAKVAALTSVTGVSIYPNPVVNKTVHIYFTNQQPGNYAITVTNNAGQVVYRSIALLNNGNEAKVFQLTQVNAGTYQVSITAPGAKRTVTKVIIN